MILGSELMPSAHEDPRFLTYQRKSLLTLDPILTVVCEFEVKIINNSSQDEPHLGVGKTRLPRLAIIPFDTAKKSQHTCARCSYAGRPQKAVEPRGCSPTLLWTRSKTALGQRSKDHSSSLCYDSWTSVALQHMSRGEMSVCQYPSWHRGRGPYASRHIMAGDICSFARDLARQTRGHGRIQPKRLVQNREHIAQFVDRVDVYFVHTSETATDFVGQLL